jgi:uncharacterized repeat protein (TIGR01451 family)
MHSRALRLLASGGTAILALALTAGAALASTTVPLQQDTPIEATECQEGSLITWHFILNGLEPGTDPATLTATFEGLTDPITVTGVPVGQGRTQHFNIETTADTLLSASAVVEGEQPDAKLVLSHIFCGPPPPPSVEIRKDGDALSKIGDQVTYSFEIENTGGWPLTLVSVVDDKVGNLTAAATTAGCDELLVDEICSFTVNFTIPVGAPDPFVNTVTATYSHSDPATVGNVTDTDSHSTNLFQPDVQIDKAANVTEAKVGDTVTYTFTITNLSSDDSPDLILDTLTDTVLGDLETTSNYLTSGCDVLGDDEVCSFTVDYTIPMGAPSSLTNVVTAHYHPDGFPNDIWDSDDHTIAVRGNEGCTPGYWKNHTGAWASTGYTTGQTLGSVFAEVDPSLANRSLLQALSFKGGNTLVGAEQILLRAAVAALLNASHDGVDYVYTEAEIIAWVNDVLDDGTRAEILALAATLDAANNQGCPL